MLEVALGLEEVAMGLVELDLDLLAGLLKLAKDAVVDVVVFGLNGLFCNLLVRHVLRL